MLEVRTPHDGRHSIARWSRFLLGMALIPALVACSASGDSNTYGNAGSGGAIGSEGGMIDTGLTGDGEIDPDSSCATTTLQAERIPLDMYLMVDTSGSMAGPKLELLKSGLKAFLEDADSAGLGTAGQKFPIGGLNETCDPVVYGTPAVPWAILPDTTLASWINTLTAEGYTPSIPALRGAVDACKARVASEPGRKCAVVFVSDGEPEGNCPPVSISADTPLGEIAAEANASDIPVFAVSFYGISSVGQKILITIAQKGGTQVPFAIKEGAVSKDFVDALAEARGAALGCEYQMPTTDTGTVNPNLVKVGYTPGSGGEPQSIPRKMSLSDCGSGPGWAYDDNDNPSKLVMCPATCDVMRADSTGKVDILLGCSSNQR